MLWYQDINNLVGKELTNLTVGGGAVTMSFSDGSRYAVEHHQDCCESVGMTFASDVPKELGIIDSITLTNPDLPHDQDYEPESFTWTELNIGLANGLGFTAQWYGTSNGYYSETADLYCEQEPTVAPPTDPAYPFAGKTHPVENW